MTRPLPNAVVLEECAIASRAHRWAMLEVFGPTIAPIEGAARSMLCSPYTEVLVQLQAELLGDGQVNGRDVVGIETRRLPRFLEDAEDGHLIVMGQVGHLRRHPSRNRDGAHVARATARDKRCASYVGGAMWCSMAPSGVRRWSLAAIDTTPHSAKQRHTAPKQVGRSLKASPAGHRERCRHACARDDLVGDVPSGQK